MLSVTGSELETVASLSNSVHLAFFGVSFGALVSFVIVLSTTTISNPQTHADYVALAALSGFGTAYFGMRMPGRS